MSQPSSYQGAIDSTNEKIQALLEEVAKLKQWVNITCELAGLPPQYTDIESGSKIGAGVGSIRHDQFFGKGIATAVKEYLRMRGNAAPTNEIYESLVKGGFEIPESWKDGDHARYLSINLAKNTADFVKVETSAGVAYGIWDFYPEKKKAKAAAKAKAKKTGDEGQEGGEESVASDEASETEEGSEAESEGTTDAVPEASVETNGVDDTVENTVDAKIEEPTSGN